MPDFEVREEAQPLPKKPNEPVSLIKGVQKWGLAKDDSQAALMLMGVAIVAVIASGPFFFIATRAGQPPQNPYAAGSNILASPPQSS